MRNIYQLAKGLIYNLLNSIIPKNDHYILLHTGLGYRDNIKAIGDYIYNNGLCKDYRVFCDLPNTNDIPLVPDKFIITTSKLRSYLIFFRCKYVFYAFGQLGAKPTKQQMIIDMWHGTPLKKINNLQLEKKRDFFFFTYVLAASELYKPIFAEAYGCPLENVFVCGHPRNDVMFKDNPMPECVNGSPYILWAPTFRKSSLLGVDNGSLDSIVPFISDEQFAELNAYLSKIGLHLLIKLHPIEDYSGKITDTFDNIHLFTHQQFIDSGYELYSVASNSIALITDYSSLAFDYLLLDKPIGYTVYDFENYENNRGLIFENPFDFMPGHMINDYDSFISFIDDITNGNDPYEKDRQRVNSLVNDYTDGNNCERVLKLAGIIK